MARKPKSFRVGKVTAYLRGSVWYLSYFENGKRRRPRAGADREVARRLAAETNAQLEASVATALSFEPISIAVLRERWLDYHEHVRRSSVATLRRYRTASQHLIDFIESTCCAARASNFQPQHAESFAAYLRKLRIAPNGHPNARKRPLRDKGVHYILEVSRSLFNYAVKRRHLPPYTANPFSVIEIDRLPVADAKPFVDLSHDQEREFLARCDSWQFPLFLTMLMTGIRPGELCHLLLPDDLDLVNGWLQITNKPDLGWQTKTRNERSIPLVPELVGVLKHLIGDRNGGPVFLRRSKVGERALGLSTAIRVALRAELDRRCAASEATANAPVSRLRRQHIADAMWVDMGAVKTDKIRNEFMNLTRSIGVPELTTPKTLRHMFATALQDANVDPLIRNELMGHVPAGGGAGAGLAMTGVYTHSRPETVRRQLEQALAARPALAVARAWLQSHSATAVA